jgi:xanthine dehydrogenase YagS FAD-binding subunit
MNAFRYARARDAADAVALATAEDRSRFIAGGTNLLDLMKDDVETPALLIDVTGLPLGAIDVRSDAIVVGALARMSDVADLPAVRSEFPVVSQALLQSASPQLRNMATIGGNLMQRTRCAYFRDRAVPCNKRFPGTGCPAIGGVNRRHAVLGASDRCICVHASDLAVALVAVDARLHLRGSGGLRTVPLRAFYRLPGATPQIETVLEHGEIITAVELPRSAAARRSHYLKVRDRASYDFALVSVAAGLDIAGGTIRSARLALGGVAPIPWHATSAERILTGSAPGNDAYAAAAFAAVEGAHGYGLNDFKIELARRCVERALRTVGDAA